ncbi:hypothetical protein ACF8D3_13500 [Acinetobacter sp. YQ_14]|uniref:hypothetical protein n=1 Tax=Acinetobacter sp. YQ_14 TaxID=3367236 RepID=UPI00370BF117
MELVVLTAINFLLLLGVWNFFLKKAVLDYYRDKLFDLRSKVRIFFLKKDMLDSKEYIELRKLINGEIAMTEELSFFSYLVWQKKIDKNPELKAYIQKDMSETYSTTDEEIQKFIVDMRRESIQVCMGYILFSSLALTVISMLAFIVFIFVNIFKHIFKQLSFKRMEKGSMKSAQIAAARLLNLTEERVEEASFLYKNPTNYLLSCQS